MFTQGQRPHEIRWTRAETRNLALEPFTSLKDISVIIITGIIIIKKKLK